MIRHLPLRRPWSDTAVVQPVDDFDVAIDRLRADYDATPYTSNSFPQSAPGLLAAIACLFGLETPDIATARVLEIGCAGGGNLLPFAAAYPHARVVGIDLSQVQIDEGRRRAKTLGLDNLELSAGDIAKIDLEALGQFDFIIAHGVYSWVPPEVQDALLSAFRRLLAPQGVAYASYNVYPGWKSKEILRDAMLLASGGSATPEDKVHHARRMVDFLEEVSSADSALARIIADSKAHALGFADSYLLHDELETFNSPCYFYEMIGRAGAHGLAFLAEAHPEAMVPANYGPRVAEYLLEKCGGVQVLVEQYLDFVADRTFRETLFVHAERAQLIRYNPDPTRFARFHIAAWAPPVDGPTRLNHSRQEFEQTEGATLFTNDPGVKAALDALSARWPWTLSRQELVEAVHDRLVSAGLTPSDSIPDLVDNLMGVLILQGQARCRLHPVPPEPVTGPLRLDDAVRRMVALTGEEGQASTFNVWHETHMLSPLDHVVLPLLDGTRDRDALLAAVRDHSISVGHEALTDYIDALPQHLEEMKLLRVRP